MNESAQKPDKKRFPADLLNQTPDERVAYFWKHTSGHRYLNESAETFLDVVVDPAGANILIVYGPPGVGKTTLLEIARRAIIERSRVALVADPGYVPIVGLPAVSMGLPTFNWPDYWSRALVALNEPLVADKRLPRAAARLSQPAAEWPFARKDTRANLLLAWEHALHERRVQAVLIDEAQHIFFGLSGRALQRQLDCVKSQADRTGVLHVLAGTYELLTARNLNAQLTRRSVDIHFPRYRREVAEDVKVFQSVVGIFQRHLPLPEEPDLLGQWEFLYERSAGCVGTLKEWLTKALATATRQEKPMAVWDKYLVKYAHSRPAALKMLQSARRAEADLAEAEEEAEEKLPRLLSTPLQRRKRSPAVPTAPAPAKRGKRPVGERAPGRDPVMEVSNAN